VRHALELYDVLQVKISLGLLGVNYFYVRQI
jgi:hypothetical protein